jgi:N,N-dimethylformamidase beta subunit-like, C-terminal
VPIASAAPPLADEPHTIVASFGRRSYAPGEAAVLTLRPWVSGESLRIFRCGPPAPRSRVDDTLSGVTVGSPMSVTSARIVLKVGDWQSGLYFARLDGPSSLRGFAPFVVRPRVPGLHRVAVVLPTNTWEAYNFRDSDHDGIGDTWYADPRIRSVDLARPFLDRGVPPHFRGYDQGFLWWLGVHHKEVDFYADDDLARMPTGAELARLYDLVVFSGHEEYVTTHAYDVVQNYRDRGGNLLFLSANNFFYRVDLRGQRIYKTGHWSALGRDGERLTGLVYLGWSHNRYRNRPYVVTGARAAPWLFRGTGLRNGSMFGNYGIEIDHLGPRPPHSVITLADIPNDFGPGRTADMIYYTTPAGAKVFSAGVMNFGGSALWPPVSRLLENLWARTGTP